MIVKTLKKIKTEIICPPKLGEIIEGTNYQPSQKRFICWTWAQKEIGVIFGKEFFIKTGP